MFNFLNLGFDGYKRIALKDLRNARMLSHALEETYFEVCPRPLNFCAPLIIFPDPEQHSYSDLEVRNLRQIGWRSWWGRTLSTWSSCRCLQVIRKIPPGQPQYPATLDSGTRPPFITWYLTHLSNRSCLGPRDGLFLIITYVKSWRLCRSFDIQLILSIRHLQAPKTSKFCVLLVRIRNF